VSYPDGGSKTITYTDAANAFSVSTSTAVASGKSHQVTQLLDGLGRPYQAQDKSAATYVDTVYNTLGQVYSVSNPYYTKSDTSYGVTTYSYDALGRVTAVQAPGGATTTTTTFAAVTSTYCTTVTDPASKVRELCADAMGRVTSVTEDPGSSPHLNYQTTYTYDPLNNLLSVTQGSQVRSYMYDYLSRLFWADTPEQGNTYICYTSSTSACSASDSSTTLCSGSASTPCRRTDARGITTTYTYDAINRITGKSYSNSNPTANAYTYDQTSCLGLTVNCYNEGRRTTMTDASGSTEWAYDSIGRVLMEQRTIGSVTKNIAYTYNLDGSASTITYPSGRTITYTVGAAQQPFSAVDTTNNVNYVLNATYAPQGAVAGAVLGESGSFGGITYAATYTNRLLPYTVTAASSAANALNLTFAYYANGNVETITNNLNTVRTESFTYDNLNRVATAQSQATSGTYCWGQSFGYDRYGNLGTVTATSCTPPTLNLSINTNNQITNSGYAYDASGDLTSDGTYTYAWDARHRLQSAGGVTYTYDGDGKRVMKSSGTLYWNSADGTPLAETNSSGTTLNEYIFFNGNRVARRDSSGNVYYYFPDHLGTTKTLTTSAGVVCYDADFTPFGHENAYITTCSQNYKFTGLERDSETGLDHTLHRKYDSTLGRWLTPDPKRGNPFNPQSWNRYAYVLDNPINFTDPYGLVNWWKVASGAWQIAVGVAGIAGGAAAELPSGGLSTLVILAGGSATGSGVIKVIAGLTESSAIAELADMYGPLTTPVGAVVGAVSGNLDAAEGASVVWDAGFNLGTLDGSSLSSGLNAFNTFAGLANTAADTMQAANANEIIYTAAEPSSIDVTGSTEPIPTVDIPVQGTIQDQGDEGDSNGGSGGGGAGGSGGGTQGNGEPCDNGATPEECAQSNQ
jgi:RHS repeat-associated protein